MLDIGEWLDMQKMLFQGLYVESLTGKLEIRNSDSFYRNTGSFIWEKDLQIACIIHSKLLVFLKTICLKNGSDEIITNFSYILKKILPL